MGVVRLDVTQRELYEDGADWGETGPYERIDAVAHYAVDPAAPGNADIADLALAARDGDGLVRFSGDVTVVRPVDPERANRVALLEVPNRGRRTMTTLFNRATPDVVPTRRIPPGDGFLQRRGFSLAWCGWQWDVPRDPGRMGLDAPVALDSSGAPLAGWVQLRIQLPADAGSVELTDHHVGPGMLHTPIPTADLEDPEAVLLVRDGLHDEPTVVDRRRWRFARAVGERAVPDSAHLWVDAGLRRGRIYDLVYRAARCPVVGVGLLAVRDLAAFLRSAGDANPLAGTVDSVVVTGISQNSRFIRTLLHLGLDADESGATAIDAALALVGGGRRGEFNQRVGQPSVQPTPGFGHLFPFADLPQTDPRTGRRAGLFDRIVSRGRPPKVFFVDSAAEYWRGDASLAHTSVVDGSDVDDAPFVRRYLYAGAQHGPGLAELTDRTMAGFRGGNLLNVVDYTPLYRGALTNLVDWTLHGTVPPPSAVPRWSDGTAARREEVLARLASIPGVALPEIDRLPVLRALDLGPEASSGIGRYPPVPFGEPYPCAVSAVDGDGNEVAGVRMPDVAVPVATHLGFNPRHPDDGAPGQLMEYSGSTVPFPVTRADRERLGDPRASLEERYPTLAAYEDAVWAAARLLVEGRHLLPDDVERCVRIARARYLAVTGTRRAGSDSR